MKNLITIAIVSTAGAALAQQPWYEWDKLTGDWGGARTSLEDTGVTPFLYYDSIIASNVSGGISTGGEFAGQIYAGADLDLEKLVGWQGAMLKVSMVDRHGDSVSNEVGGIYDPMCIYGGQVTYLYQLFIEQQIGDAWSLKFGRVSADNDFAKSPLYGYSLSTAINGPIRATLLENSLTSFPYAVWGARLKYQPCEEHQFQLGAYQIGDSMWDYTEHGTDFSFRSDDGVSLIAQYDWRPDFNGRDARVFAGVINSFFDFTDFDGAGETDHLFRAYIHGEVEIIDDLTLFGMATWSPHDEVAKTPVQLSCGANIKGLIPGRENDHTMAFITYGSISGDYADSVGADLDYEMVYELGHRVQLTPAFYVQPSVQYVQRPGGSGDIDDAVVLGAWVGAAF